MYRFFFVFLFFWEERVDINFFYVVIRVGGESFLRLRLGVCGEEVIGGRVVF